MPLPILCVRYVAQQEIHILLVYQEHIYVVPNKNFLSDILEIDCSNVHLKIEDLEVKLCTTTIYIRDKVRVRRIMKNINSI